MRKLLIVATLLVQVLLLSSCARWAPLMGEEHVPGFTEGNIPDEFRGQVNPFTLDDQQALAAGQQLYNAYCSYCHGFEGKGDGFQSYYLEPRPADFTSPSMHRAFQQNQDYVFWWISEGVTQSAMPAFGHNLTGEQIWQVVIYEQYLAEQATK